MSATTTTGYIMLKNLANGMISVAYSAVNDANGFTAWIPAKKGDTITIVKYDKSLILLRFVYAQGEVPV